MESENRYLLTDANGLARLAFKWARRPNLNIHPELEKIANDMFVALFCIIREKELEDEDLYRHSLRFTTDYPVKAEDEKESGGPL